MSRIMDEMRKEAAAKAIAEVSAKIAKENVERTKKMLKDNLSIEKVVEYSGLSVEEVEKLKQEIQKKSIAENNSDDINGASTKIIDEVNLYAQKTELRKCL